jgi:hypothetical protein
MNPRISNVPLKMPTLFGSRVIAVVALTLLLFASTVLISGARQARAASPDAVSARKATECSRPARIKEPRSIVRLAPPSRAARTVTPVGFFMQEEGDTQWCWGRSCVHVEFSCPDQGASPEDVSPCCVVCCWDSDPSNCSDEVCCEPKMD